MDGVGSYSTPHKRAECPKRGGPLEDSSQVQLDAGIGAAGPLVAIRAQGSIRGTALGDAIRKRFVVVQFGRVYLVFAHGV